MYSIYLVILSAALQLEPAYSTYTYPVRSAQQDHSALSYGKGASGLIYHGELPTTKDITKAGTKSQRLAQTARICSVEERIQISGTRIPGLYKQFKLYTDPPNKTVAIALVSV